MGADGDCTELTNNTYCNGYMEPGKTYRLASLYYIVIVLVLYIYYLFSYNHWNITAIIVTVIFYIIFRIRVFTCTEAGCTASAYAKEVYSTEKTGKP